MKTALMILTLIIISGCTFIDQKGGEYSVTSEKNKLKDNLIIDKCSVPTGFACIDYSATTENIKVTIKNSIPTDMEKFYIAVYCGKSESTTMPNGAMKQFTIPCTLEKDTQFESELYILYKDKYSGLTHRKQGTLKTIVK